jgi:hypothetical protein
MDGKPNPGSKEALALGCTCPVLDNAHGEGITYGGERAWWINRKCPIHERGSDDGKRTDFEKEADYRMEAIRAWATVVQSLMMQGPDFAGESVGYLSRIIELAKEADE